MAIALGLNPAWKTQASAPSVFATNAFSPPANSLIIIDSHCDGTSASLSPTIVDSVGLTWTAIGTAQRGVNGGFTMSWWAYTVVARTNMTATVTWGVAATKAIKATTYTGTATTGAVIAQASNNSLTNNLTVNVTTTNAGCRIRGNALDWQALGLPTSTDDATPPNGGYHVASQISGVIVHKAADTAVAGTSVSLNFDAFGAGVPDWGYKVSEILPAAGSAIDLVVAKANQAQTSQSPTLTQQHVLVVQKATQAHTSQSPALTQASSLTVQNAVQSQASQSPTLTQASNLTVAKATQAQTSTNPTLVLVGDPGVVPWVRDARQGGTGGTNTALNHSVPIPTCQVGDDLWASFTLNGGHGAVTEPSGWTRIFPTTITDDGFMTLLIYRKTATSTEVAGGNITAVVATAVRGNSGSMAIVGADTAAAPDGAVNSTSTAGTTSVSHTVVASTDNSLILSILALDSAAEDPTPTAPLVQWWDPMESGIIGQGNAGAVVHRPTAGSASYGWTWTTSLARKAWTASIRSVAGVTSLTVASASQAQTSTTPTLTQVHNLTVAKATQGQASQSPTLTQVHNLVVAKATQGQAAQSPTLTQVHNLAVQKATQAQTAGAVALVQTHNLVVAKASQGQTAQAPSLTQVHNLVVAKSSQAQTAQNVTLSTTGSPTLVVSNATQLQTAGNVKGNLAANPSLETNGTDWGPLVGANSAFTRITTGGAYEGAAFGRVTWTAPQTTTPDGGIRIANVLVPPGPLDVEIAVRSSVAQRLRLQVWCYDSASNFLGDASGIIEQVVVAGDWTVLKSRFTLKPNTVRTTPNVRAFPGTGSALWQTGDTLDGDLLIVDVTDVTLTQVHNLTVQDAAQAQTSQSPTLTQVHNLVVQKATQAQTAGVVTLAPVAGLVVAKATHSQSARNLVLVQQHSLAVAKATQQQTARNIALTQVHKLGVANAVHQQAAGIVTLTVTTEVILTVSIVTASPITASVGSDGPVIAAAPRV